MAGHLPLGGSDNSLEVLCADQFTAARETIESFPEVEAGSGSSSFARQNLDQNPEPFLGLSIFLDLRPAHPLGDSMVKFRGSQIQAASVSYYHFEFVQALARLIAIYGASLPGSVHQVTISLRGVRGDSDGIYSVLHLTR